ncbi:TPA: ead/Ea22-like family protein [Escherichia coli]|uniref:ead/Ea22-like family protein n=1 Tax=Escherichia coli TaxID=562 RepID=UPI000F5EA2B4|nr:ead/Ea22-like family protein [Escherichia coli]MCG9396542.1 ead/Ea22-like family protein [Escherichia coli]RRB96060.1 ead/Ea22-like family protein [Escherichia coli]HAH9343277.1 ead/Ea22-like family protein [Escherichia coli]HBB0332029.1 ead/Ea22-like family protein [Escherichia coli]
MSNINKQELREAAEKASTDNHTQDEWFHYLRCSTPETVLALLDDLEAAEKRVAELEAREVKLPKLSVAAVMHMSGFSLDYAEGWCAGNDNARHEIHVAGIRINGEG